MPHSVPTSKNPKHSQTMHCPALHATASTNGIAEQSRPPSAERSPNGESSYTHPPQLSRSRRTSTHSCARRNPRLPVAVPYTAQLFCPRGHAPRFSACRRATLVGFPPPAATREDGHQRGRAGREGGKRYARHWPLEVSEQVLDCPTLMFPHCDALVEPKADVDPETGQFWQCGWPCWDWNVPAQLCGSQPRRRFSQLRPPSLSSHRRRGSRPRTTGSTRSGPRPAGTGPRGTAGTPGPSRAPPRSAPAGTAGACGGRRRCRTSRAGRAGTPRHPCWAGTCPASTPSSSSPQTRRVGRTRTSPTGQGCTTSALGLERNV